MKLSESCLVVCALVASLGSAGAAEADDFKTLYARADLGGSMRGTALMRGPSRIKEQKSLARDKATKERDAIQFGPPLRCSNRGSEFDARFGPGGRLANYGHSCADGHGLVSHRPPALQLREWPLARVQHD